MPSTTLDALRTALRSAIEGITIDTTRGSAQAWHWVESAKDIGAGYRTFTVEIDGGLSFLPEGGMFSSDAISYATEMRTVVGYGGLQQHEFQVNINADARQIYQAINSANITGLELITPNGFDEDSDSVDGRRSGAHKFTIRYLLSNST